MHTMILIFTGSSSSGYTDRVYIYVLRNMSTFCVHLLRALSAQHSNGCHCSFSACLPYSFVRLFCNFCQIENSFIAPRFDTRYLLGDYFATSTVSTFVSTYYYDRYCMFMYVQMTCVYRLLQTTGCIPAVCTLLIPLPYCTSTCTCC